MKDLVLLRLALDGCHIDGDVVDDWLVVVAAIGRCRNRARVVLAAVQRLYISLARYPAALVWLIYVPSDTAISHELFQKARLTHLVLNTKLVVNVSSIPYLPPDKTLTHLPSRYLYYYYYYYHYPLPGQTRDACSPLNLSSSTFYMYNTAMAFVY